jgi:hypothetical protein
MSNNTTSKVCPNPDCDNTDVIDVETDTTFVACELCGTPLVPLVSDDHEEDLENEEENEEEDSDEDDFIEDD